MSGHTDEWCKANCDAKKFAELDKVISTTLPFYVHTYVHSIERLIQKFVSSASRGYQDMP